MAEDVEPPEVVAHLPLLCTERKIPYLYVSSKQQLGASLGMDVPSAACAIIESGEAQPLLEQILASLSKIQVG
jgi:large subunit ribosomal protein L7Ae